MLYGFTRAGYPDIPRYTFRDTLEALLRSPNRQLRGAALRVKALCLRDGRADLWDAEETDPVSLLRQSVGCLASSQDVRELALSRHELANTLERLGRHDEMCIRDSTHALARLGAPDMALDDCTAIAEAIGDELGKQRPGSIICMECALRFLIAWGERHLYTAGGSESCLYGRLALTFQLSLIHI